MGFAQFASRAVQQGAAPVLRSNYGIPAMFNFRENRFRSASGPDLAAGFGLVGLWAVWSKLARLRLRSVANRQVANSLGELDDHLLADIGLVRSDLSDALNKTGPFDDPTPALSHAARSRAWRRFERPVR